MKLFFALTSYHKGLLEAELSMGGPSSEDLREFHLAAPKIFDSPFKAMEAAAIDWSTTMLDILTNDGMELPEHIVRRSISPLVFAPSSEGLLEGQPLFPGIFDIHYRITAVRLS